jgi:PIN domain nuclease of toxin-antitoxin system
VKLLLDTHVVLWWVSGHRRLKADARKAITAADIVWVSSATAMELALKVSRRRLRLPEPIAVTLAADDFTELQLTVAHAERLATLPVHHGDPFDRVLVAQAQIEGATIVTHDRAFEKYGMPVIWT